MAANETFGGAADPAAPSAQHVDAEGARPTGPGGGQPMDAAAGSGVVPESEEAAEVAEAAQESAPAHDAVAEDDSRSSEELRAALAEAERARDEFLDYLRRERAEFENFRKRTTRERMDALDRGAEQLVVNLLGVLDHFGFALEAAESSEDDRLAKGVQMVHNELLSVLRQAGLEELPGVGSDFDPAVHEAIAQEGDGDGEPTVVGVLRPGYRFKGRVLRPASVKVTR